MTMPGAEENGEDCAKCKPLEKKVRGAHPRLRLPVLCALSVSARVWARRRCANLHTRSTDLTNGPRGGWSVSRRVSTRVGKVFRGAASTKQGAGQAMGVSQHGGAMREQGTAWDSAGAARLPLRGYARCRDHCLAPSTDLLRMPKLSLHPDWSCAAPV